MISPRYCATLARYNRWQNKSLVAAANTLDAGERDHDRGAFFRSVTGTFSHLIWADHLWMSRFDGWETPRIGIPESAGFVTDWAEFKTKRTISDARIVRWADNLSETALSGEMTWFSGALGREVTKPKDVCVVHFFNHQTHHRGQLHAMLTAAGAAPDDTDLFIMPEDA